MITHYYVYVLVDPITNKIRYIGRTKNPDKRYVGHLNGNSNGYILNWVDNLKQQGKRPILKIIDDTCDFERIKEIELDLIRTFDRRFLLNNDGG